MGVFKQLFSLIQDGVGSIRLAADLKSRVRLMTDFCLARLMRVHPIRGIDQIRQIQLRGGGTLSYRLNRADIYTIHEIWIEEMYRLPYDLKPHVLVDLGANIGLASLWIARQYGCEHIIAVEPSPSNAALACENLAAYSFVANVVEAAVGCENGVVLFDAGPGATNGRIVCRHPSSNTILPSQYTVRVMDMASILCDLPASMQIDLMKIDIEGGEQDLLTSNTGWLRRVSALIIEFHPNLVDYDRLIAILGENCFRRVTMLSTNSQGNTLEFWTRQSRS